MSSPKNTTAKRTARVKRAGTGKIAHLPAHIRMQVSRRLHDGDCGAVIVAWLNGNAEVADALRRNLPHHPATITEQNVSAFRHGTEHQRHVALFERALNP